MADNSSILDALLRHGIPFVIIGGHAVNFHGYLRSTEDVDVVWLRSPESEQSLARALLEIDAQYIGKEIDPSTGVERTVLVSLPYIQASHLMMLWTGAGFLILFDYIPGFADTDVSELFKTSVESRGMRVASLRWIRQMKEVTARPKDLLDLKNLPSVLG